MPRRTVRVASGRALAYARGMGMMPPYDPLTDPSLAWAIVRVESIEPAKPTWSRPGRVVFDGRDVDVPEVGARLGVWLSRDGDRWDIPTLRSLGALMAFPMRPRWVEEAHLDALRGRLTPTSPSPA